LMAIVESFAGGDLHVWPELAITVTFAALARLIKGVDGSGAVAGAAVSYLLLRSAGLGAFAVLVSLFALTCIRTLFG
jgi:hypothetical protein